MAFKLEPLVLTYTIIFFLKQYRSNSLVKLFANACCVVSNASNNPTLICFNF